MRNLFLLNFDNLSFKQNRLVFESEVPDSSRKVSPDIKSQLIEKSEAATPEELTKIADARYQELMGVSTQALSKLPEAFGNGHQDKLRVKLNDFIIAKLAHQEHDKDLEEGLDEEEFALFRDGLSVGVELVIGEYQQEIETFISNGSVMLVKMDTFTNTLEKEYRDRLDASYWTFVKPSNLFGLSGYLPGMEGESFLEKEQKEVRDLFFKESDTRNAAVSAFGKIANGENPATAFAGLYGPEGNYFRALADKKDPELALAQFYLEKGQQIKSSGVSDLVQGLSSGFLNQAIDNATRIQTGNEADELLKKTITERANAILPKGFEKFRSEYMVGVADMFLSYDQLLLLAASGGVGNLLGKSAKLSQIGLKLNALSASSKAIRWGSKLVPGFEAFAASHTDKIGMGALKLLGNFTGEISKVVGWEWVAGKAGEAVGGEEGKAYAQKGVALFCFLIPGAKPAFERSSNSTIAGIFAKESPEKAEALFKEWVSQNYTKDQIRELIRKGVTAHIEDAAMASGKLFLRDNPVVKGQLENQVEAVMKQFTFLDNAQYLVKLQGKLAIQALEKDAAPLTETLSRVGELQAKVVGNEKYWASNAELSQWITTAQSELSTLLKNPNLPAPVKSTASRAYRGITDLLQQLAEKGGPAADWAKRLVGRDPALRQQARQVAAEVFNTKIDSLVQAFSVGAMDTVNFLRGSEGSVKDLIILLKGVSSPEGRAFLLAKRDVLIKGASTFLNSLERALGSAKGRLGAEVEGKTIALFDELALLIGRFKIKQKFVHVAKHDGMEFIARWIEKGRVADHTVKHVIHGEGHGEVQHAGGPAPHLAGEGEIHADGPAQPSSGEKQLHSYRRDVPDIGPVATHGRKPDMEG